MTARDFISRMMGKGRYCFTSNEAEQAFGRGEIAARASLRRLRQKGSIAMPYKGFYVIVPPDYEVIGCLPASDFVPDLMAHLQSRYYAGLLSAAEYHGAAHQRPQIFQIITERNRPAIACGKVRAEFIARKNMAEIPVVDFKTPRGYLKISTPAATAFDLVGYPNRAGGLDNVATVLSELNESIDPEELARIGVLSPIAWTQRLGYLLELVGAEGKAQGLAEYVARRKPIFTLLSPPDSSDNPSRSKRWRLVVNVHVEAEV